MEGREVVVVGGGGWVGEAARGKGGVKEQEGFVKKVGEEYEVLGEGTESRDRGRRGQEGKGVINEGRAARRMDEEGEMERVRG